MKNEVFLLWAIDEYVVCGRDRPKIFSSLKAAEDYLDRFVGAINTIDWSRSEDPDGSVRIIVKSVEEDDYIVSTHYLIEKVPVLD